MANTWCSVLVRARFPHPYLGLRGGLLGKPKSFLKGVLGPGAEGELPLSFRDFFPILKRYAGGMAWSSACTPPPEARLEAERFRGNAGSSVEFRCHREMIAYSPEAFSARKTMEINKR